MAGKLIQERRETIITGNSSGYITVSSVTGFYKKARAWISDVQPDRPANREVEITEVLTGTNQLGIRYLRGPGEGCNYGRDSMAAHVPEIRLNYTGIVGTGTVTGTNSTETATVVSSTATYLVISSPSGAFVNGEELTFTAGGPAEAVGTQYTVESAVSMPKQFIYNSNDKPLD